MSTDAQLLADLRSADWEVAVIAAGGLRDIPGEEVTHALAAALDAHDTAITQAALDALLARGDPATADLVWDTLATVDGDLGARIWLFLERHPDHPVTQELQARRSRSGLPPPGRTTSPGKRKPHRGAPIGDRLEHALEERTDIDAQIARGESQSPSRSSIVRKLVWLTITGISLYVVAPSLLDTLGSWRDIERFAPIWLLAMAVLQGATLVCLWWLQVIALHTRDWFAIATSQLAGNGIAKVAPGGGAVGAALQYKMLVRSGLLRARVVSGLTAVNLLTLAAVLALPLLALPALLGGSVDRGLAQASIAGLAVFAVLFGVGALMIALDGPLRWVGRQIQRVRNRLRRGSQPLTGLPSRLLRERDRILATVGVRWKAALTATIGRWVFDYATLMAALAAVGSSPRPALVLLAFCGSQLLAQIPLTPGGLGFVEAGLAALLALAGVAPAEAVLATFAYRLFTYWLPLPLGLLGAILHRRRYEAVPGAAAA